MLVIQRGGAYFFSAVVLKIRQSQPIAERAQNFPARTRFSKRANNAIETLYQALRIDKRTRCLNIDTLTPNSACLSAACAAAGFAASYSTSTFNTTTARRGCSNSSAADKPPTSGSAPAM